MLAKHPGDRKITSSASSDQQSEASKKDFLDDISQISDKIDVMHNAASSIQKVWRGYVSRKNDEFDDGPKPFFEANSKKVEKDSSSKKPPSYKEEASSKAKNFDIQYTEAKSGRSGLEVV